MPQGLTAAGAYLFVSSYKPTPDLKANTGPCRVFRIEYLHWETRFPFIFQVDVGKLK